MEVSHNPCVDAVDPGCDDPFVFTSGAWWGDDCLALVNTVLVDMGLWWCGWWQWYYGEFTTEPPCVTLSIWIERYNMDCEGYSMWFLTAAASAWGWSLFGDEPGPCDDYAPDSISLVGDCCTSGSVSLSYDNGDYWASISGSGVCCDTPMDAFLLEWDGFGWSCVAPDGTGATLECYDDFYGPDL